MTEKIDFVTLSEIGLKRFDAGGSLVVQESCSLSPSILISLNGDLITRLDYNKLKELNSFISSVIGDSDRE